MTPPYLRGKAAALEKLGMGERQMARVLAAIRREIKLVKETRKLPEGLQSPSREQLYKQVISDKPAFVSNKSGRSISRRQVQHQDLDYATLRGSAKADPERRMALQEHLQTKTSPLIRPNDVSLTNSYIDDARSLREFRPQFIKELAGKTPEERHTLQQTYREMLQRVPEIAIPPNEAQIINTFTSGRHSPDKNIVRILNPNEVSPATAHLQPGVDPKRVGWRGAVPREYKGKTPLWYSGIPEVAGGYARHTPLGRLRAYDISDIAKKHQGPWTPHISVEPFTDPNAFKKRIKLWEEKHKAQLARDAAAGVTTPVGAGVTHTGRATVGSSPFYEKVIKAKANPPLLADYKPIHPTEPIFMRTRGEPLLKASNFEKTAVNRLVRYLESLKKIPQAAELGLLPEELRSHSAYKLLGHKAQRLAERKAIVKPPEHTYDVTRRIQETLSPLAESDPGIYRRGVLSGLLHDVGKAKELKTGIPHAELGARRAEKLLRKQPALTAAVPGLDQGQLADAIRAHNRTLYKQRPYLRDVGQADPAAMALQEADQVSRNMALIGTKRGPALSVAESAPPRITPIRPSPFASQPQFFGGAPK